MSYFGGDGGLGLNMEDLLKHARSMKKIQDRQELRLAPLMNETFALQAANIQAQQQTTLQRTQLEQKAEQSSKLMDLVPYVLGGVALLGGAVLVLRSRRKR